MNRQFTMKPRVSPMPAKVRRAVWPKVMPTGRLLIIMIACACIGPRVRHARMNVLRINGVRTAAASPTQQKVTQLLVDGSSGDKAALDKLIPLVQPELHRLAHYYMSREKEGHTLQTALVIIKDHSRCSFAQFKLVAHLLDLRGLLFETCREGLNLLLLLRN